MYFKEMEKKGYNPVTKEHITCIRRTLYLEEKLPIGESYANLINTIIRANDHASQ